MGDDCRGTGLRSGESPDGVVPMAPAAVYSVILTELLGRSVGNWRAADGPGAEC